MRLPAIVVAVCSFAVLFAVTPAAADETDKSDKKTDASKTKAVETNAEPAELISAEAEIADDTVVEKKVDVSKPGYHVGDTWFELHGYARMPINLQSTPREPFLIDNDYFLSGFSYTRLYEPDWTELFLSAHNGNYTVRFGLFASLYSDYATPELENQFGIAQASVRANKFLNYDQLSVELGVFWDRFGHIAPYDTYMFGRTHQGGLKTRWQFKKDAHLQVGLGAHQEQLQQNQGLTPVAHINAQWPFGKAVVGGYLLRSWTRDKRQLSPIQDGDLWVAGADVRYDLPKGLGKAYLAASYYKASKVLYLAPALELMHSTGGRGLTENFLGLDSSNDGTGSLYNLAADIPLTVTKKVGVRAFGMMSWVRSDQVDAMNPLMNRDRRLYLKWGVEPGYKISDTIRASLRYDRVILDMHDAENSFRVFSPRVSFPLSKWGELFVMFSHYRYGDKIQLRPGQVPLETMPDSNVFKVQAQAIW